jgi:hypothetical protein
MKATKNIGITSQSLIVRDNMDFKKLLDVASSIIANEYIEIAKENKDVFGIASPPTADRNDEGKHGGLE